MKKWPDGASAKLDQLRDWYQHYRGCNWGMATGPMSGVWILDLDGEKASRFFLDLKERSSDDTWTYTRTVKTAKGRHIWFEYPKIPIRNSAGQIAPGVDVRGDGGYVVIPPSEHESGAFYSWVAAPDVAVLPAPDMLLKLLTERNQISPGNGNVTRGRPTAMSLAYVYAPDGVVCVMRFPSPS